MATSCPRLQVPPTKSAQCAAASLRAHDWKVSGQAHLRSSASGSRIRTSGRSAICGARHSAAHFEGENRAQDFFHRRWRSRCAGRRTVGVCTGARLYEVVSKLELESPRGRTPHSRLQHSLKPSRAVNASSKRHSLNPSSYFVAGNSKAVRSGNGRPAATHGDQFTAGGSDTSAPNRATIRSTSRIRSLEDSAALPGLEVLEDIFDPRRKGTPALQKPLDAESAAVADLESPPELHVLEELLSEGGGEFGAAQGVSGLGERGRTPEDAKVGLGDIVKTKEVGSLQEGRVGVNRQKWIRPALKGEVENGNGEGTSKEGRDYPRSTLEEALRTVSGSKGEIGASGGRGLRERASEPPSKPPIDAALSDGRNVRAPYGGESGEEVWASTSPPKGETRQNRVVEQSAAGSGVSQAAGKSVLRSRSVDTEGRGVPGAWAQWLNSVSERKGEEKQNAVKEKLGRQTGDFHGVGVLEGRGFGVDSRSDDRFEGTWSSDEGGKVAQTGSRRVAVASVWNSGENGASSFTEGSERTEEPVLRRRPLAYEKLSPSELFGEEPFEAVAAGTGLREAGFQKEGRGERWEVEGLETNYAGDDVVATKENDVGPRKRGDWVHVGPGEAAGRGADGELSERGPSWVEAAGIPRRLEGAETGRGRAWAVDTRLGPNEKAGVNSVEQAARKSRLESGLGGGQPATRAWSASDRSGSASGSGSGFVGRPQGRADVSERQGRFAETKASRGVSEQGGDGRERRDAERAAAKDRAWAAWQEFSSGGDRSPKEMSEFLAKWTAENAATGSGEAEEPVNEPRSVGGETGRRRSAVGGREAYASIADEGSYSAFAERAAPTKVFVRGAAKGTPGGARREAISGSKGYGSDADGDRRDGSYSGFAKTTAPGKGSAQGAAQGRRDLARREARGYGSDAEGDRREASYSGFVTAAPRKIFAREAAPGTPGIARSESSGRGREVRPVAQISRGFEADWQGLERSGESEFGRREDNPRGGGSDRALSHPRNGGGRTLRDIAPQGATNGRQISGDSPIASEPSPETWVRRADASGGLGAEADVSTASGAAGEGADVSENRDDMAAAGAEVSAASGEALEWGVNEGADPDWVGDDQLGADTWQGWEVEDDDDIVQPTETDWQKVFVAAAARRLQCTGREPETEPEPADLPAEAAPGGSPRAPFEELSEEEQKALLLRESLDLSVRNRVQKLKDSRPRKKPRDERTMEERGFAVFLEVLPELERQKLLCQKIKSGQLVWAPCCVYYVIHHSHTEILRFFNARTRALARQWKLGYSATKALNYYMRSSCALTLAIKNQLKSRAAAYRKWGRELTDPVTRAKFEMKTPIPLGGWDTIDWDRPVGVRAVGGGYYTPEEMRVRTRMVPQQITWKIPTVNDPTLGGKWDLGIETPQKARQRTKPDGGRRGRR